MNDAYTLPKFEIWSANAGEAPRLHRRRGVDFGARNRSEHRDLLCRKQRAASPLGLSRSATALFDPGYLAANREVLSFDPSQSAWLPHLAEGMSFVRKHRRRRRHACRHDGGGLAYPDP